MNTVTTPLMFQHYHGAATVTTTPQVVLEKKWYRIWIPQIRVHYQRNESLRDNPTYTRRTEHIVVAKVNLKPSTGFLAKNNLSNTSYSTM